MTVYPIHVDKRGPAAFDLRANFQKRDNLRASFKKTMYKTTDSQDLKVKKER